MPTTFENISSRLRVETGNDVLIGGFIVTGKANKKVLVRALGPSLTKFGITDVLTDPTLELHDHTGATIASNDNWKVPSQAAIQATGLAPGDDAESAIVTLLAPSSYTAVVRGKDNTSGVGLLEVYDLDPSVNSKLANISARGLVGTGDDVMIGGFIVRGSGNEKIIVRALGPSVPVPGHLADPTLELHNSNGTLLASNDNWRSTQQAEIIATGVPPTNDLESAIVISLAPGPYTAIVRGKNNTSGVALVEAYDLP